MYDVIIIGGGPGGVAAGVYSARKQMKTLFVTENFLSQSTVSASIENWIGTVTIPGFEFAQSLERHLRAQEGIEILTGVKATAVTEQDGRYTIVLSDGTQHETKAVIVATGGRHRHLDIPGEETFNGKGVVYCSTCDAPFFRNKNVVVVGGGNAGLEAVEDLLPYASSITLMIRSDVLRGDAVTQDRILTNEKVHTLYNAVPQVILGETAVTGVLYKDALTGEEKTLSTDGVFVEIGMVPNTEFIKDLITLNERGEIVLDHRTKATSKVGIFAVGDATDAPYKQNNISAGDGVVAALAVYEYIKKQR
ncbi:MAG: FAD-dependent oxidoreductase [Candidatus Moranbacteria bacterium]|nr:FAD-dependent oxidoreductase [Candidatus Moranbacteria bacterium]MDD3965138.1 FAD-dependent oxidoreductase [Candidatus Moranbacteria bacterium]